MLTALSERLVTDKLEISFEGRRYDVRNVPDVRVGEKIKIGKNPYRPECVQVECRELIIVDGEQKERLYWTVLEPIEINEHGFRVDAAIIGEEYKAHKKTAFEINKEKAEKLAYGVDNEEDLKRAKKANVPLFGGEINPYKHIEDEKLALYLPKRGQEHELTANAKRVELPLINPVEMLKRLKAVMGEAYSAEVSQFVLQRYPQGMTEPELEALIADPKLPYIAKPLRIING